MFNLASELAQGHKVIVGVESSELWGQNPILTGIAHFFGIEHADHAVIVSSIDTSDPEHPKVIVTDPGTGDVAKSYPLDHFLDAWHGSHFAMVSTDTPAPPTSFGMEHFDYHTGHIPMVGNVPYEAMEHMNDAAQMEHDPVAAHEMSNMFMSMASGHGVFDQIFQNLDLQHAAHPFEEMTSRLASLTHGNLSADSPLHALARLFHHDPATDAIHDPNPFHDDTGPVHNLEGYDFNPPSNTDPIVHYDDSPFHHGGFDDHMPDLFDGHHTDTE